MRKTTYVALILMGLAHASCHVLYYPNSINSPLLRNKGDAQINASVGASGYEAQIAYAITNNIGIMANGQVLKNTNHDSINEQRTLTEIGIGYTEVIGDNGIFEFYGGAGFGRVPFDTKTSNYNGTQTTPITRYFLQPGIGFFNDLMDISIVTRLSAVDIADETNWFFEPGVMTKIGYKRIRLYACAGVSIPFKRYDERLWNHNPIMFSVGLHVNIGKRIDE
ncbi:MAG: hypothetical protein H6536_01185 [Bacteroidales bacterium]|nr:hypothetical protein [Bacteroidales bacterium]